MTYMIFYDRGYRAQDNGEYLCRYVMKNRPDIKTGYILNSTSYDWERLKNEGFNLIDKLDKNKTREELLKCDYACSSIFNEGTQFNFNGCTCKRIFLNHGCFLVPINYIKAEHNNIDLFIADNKIEYKNFLNPYHQLTKDQVVLCGQPRHDELVKAQQKEHKEDSILIQFWQRPGEWAKDNNKKFLSSAFYKKTCELLSNEKLINTCKKYNLKIIFKMHSIQYNWLDYYKKFENNIIKLSPLSERFEPVFIRSKMIITDISSNAYEMAKINKPCIYFEPDNEELFNWRLKRNGNFEFDLDKNSIGPVIKASIEKVVEQICLMIENNYQLDQQYINKRIEQISFINDTNNCKRCLEAILKVKTSRTALNTEKLKKEQANKKMQKADGKANYYLYF